MHAQMFKQSWNYNFAPTPDEITEETPWRGRRKKLHRRKKARGPHLTGNAMRQESGVEVSPLNKHKEDGSRNNREVQAETRRGTAFDHVDPGLVSLMC